VARLEVKMDSWLKKGGDPPRKNGGHDKDQWGTDASRN
jgi:hypothetical protein